MLTRLVVPAAKAADELLGHNSKGHVKGSSSHPQSFCQVPGEQFLDNLRGFTEPVGKIFQSLFSGPSPQVDTLARVAAADQRITIAENNRLIYRLIKLDTRVATTTQVQTKLRRHEPNMSDYEERIAGRAVMLKFKAKTKNCA